MRYMTCAKIIKDKWDMYKTNTNTDTDIDTDVDIDVDIDWDIT